MGSPRLTVYLAGPVSFLSGKEALSWRQYVERLNDANEWGFKLLNPLRGKEDILGDSSLLPHGYDGLAADQVIYRMCHWDVHRCDVVLCNLVGAEKVSIGSCMELAWAHQAGKYVITCIEDDNPHAHSFVYQASSVILPTLVAGLDYLVEHV